MSAARCFVIVFDVGHAELWHHQSRNGQVKIGRRSGGAGLWQKLGLVDKCLGVGCAEFGRATTNCIRFKVGASFEQLHGILIIIIFARRPEFLENLVTERGADLSPTIKMKLLNIEAAASLLMRNDYKGSHLPADSSIYDVPLAYSKNKQILVTGLLDALKSLIPSETYVRTGVDTKMGFVIGEFGLKNIESKFS